MAPKLSILLHEVGAARDEGTLAAVTDKHVLPLYNLRTRGEGYEVSAMKTLLELRGLAGGPVRPPLIDIKTEEQAELQAKAKKEEERNILVNVRVRH